MLAGMTAAVAGGCSRVPVSYVYDGPPRPAGQVAYLTDSGSARIEQIDYRNVGFGKADIRLAERYELLPGPHWIAVSYWSQSGNMTYRSTQDITVRLVMEGGGRYQVEAWTRDGKWLPLVRNLVTDKVVAGPVPKSGTPSGTK